MYFAHISEDGRKQTVKEHLENTAAIAAEFAKPINMSEQAYTVGLLHDIGKYSEGFQKRLLGGPKVDHSTAGAIEAIKRRMAAEAFCIAGHHSGIPDGGSRTSLEGPSLCARVNRATRGGIEPYGTWLSEISIPNIKPVEGKNVLELSLLIRMLYSCLVDADYLDTENFMNGALERGCEFDVQKLWEKLSDYISPWFPAKNKLNELRCEILNHVMKEGRSLAQGLYTLTVPTGGGKTIASMAFAIEHAKKNGLKRIIYVIPYTSIIEQTAEVFRQIFGSDAVLEHHSNVERGDDEESLFYFRATENWDMPIIVTTSVQFFESFFKNKSSSSRKLHNVANSVIIFDEAQMLPLPYIRPCVSLMCELVECCSDSIILCTATQPSLDLIIAEFSSCYVPYELCPEQCYENLLFKRVSFVYDQKYSLEKLVDCINQNEQCLCIVNSRKAAQQIYELMGNGNCFHLSTNMYPAHRKRVLKEIRNRLIHGKPCIVISTSLIEAGVDVDFPCVYRQIAGLDSLLQAGGRCNREGKRGKSESIVHIFDLECGSPELFSTQIAAAEEVLNEYKDITTKDAIKAYFEKLFYLKGSEALDQFNIIQQMRTKNFPFKEISEQFNLIDSNTYPIYIETADNGDLLEKLRLGYANKQDMRKLGLFVVNIYKYQLMKLREQFAVEELADGSCILINSTLYSNSVGLNLEFKTGEAIMI